MSGAQIGSLRDLKCGWPTDGQIFLDRFTYGTFSGQAKTDPERRIAWLDSQCPRHLEKDFRPQPWKQCAKVLRETGHEDDAREVLIAKEERQRRARREVLRTEGRNGEARLRSVIDWVLWATVDYGRQPLKAFWSLLAMLVLGWVIFTAAAANDQIKPNNAVVLRSPEWARCADAPAAHIGYWQRGAHDTQRACFEAQETSHAYPRFSAFVYSLDTLLPIVAMEMQSFWIPDETKGWIGWFARIYLWFHIALGWALSLLAVAGFSGLIRIDNT